MVVSAFDAFHLFDEHVSTKIDTLKPVFARL